MSSRTTGHQGGAGFSGVDAMTGVPRSGSSVETVITVETVETVEAVDELASRIRAAGAAATRRRVVVLTVVGLVAALAFAAELVVGGSASIPLGDVLPAALGLRDGLADYVIHETRLPRALTAVLAGALLGLGGCLYQRLIGNPLATPDVIGVSGGASAGAVVVLTLLGGSGVAVQSGALVGALLVAGGIYWLSWRGGVDTYRLVLVGIGLGACCAAITSYLISRTSEMTMNRAMRWMIGSLNAAGWPGVSTLLVSLILGVVGVSIVSRGLATLGLGDDLATGLGTRVGSLRVVVLLLGAALAAMATSVVGPIAFVALVAGPIATRLLRRTDALLAGGVIGATILLVSDVLAQSAPVISPIPTGTLTALVGAPILVYLLIRQRPTAA